MSKQQDEEYKEGLQPQMGASSSSSSIQSSPDIGIKLIAHRGNGPTSKMSGNDPNADVPPSFAPENTLKSFTKAIEAGADGIELDVFISKDGIPMVIHDDELNVNVRGVNRKTRELGLVSEKTLEELKKYDIGQGEKIPTLEETILLISELNKKHGKNLILNVELKGTNAAQPTYDIVKKYIDSGHINQKDVIYCSFNHEALKELKKINPNNLVAPGIKTATLFGEENLGPGWVVKPCVSYQEGAIQKLDALAKELGVVALDAVLWDIEQEFVDVAKSNKIDVHASTSDFRSFENKAFLEFLVKMQKQVQVYFKTDEPKVIREMLQGRNRPIELDFSGSRLLPGTKNIKITQSELTRLAKPKINEAAAGRPPVGSMKFSPEGPASIATEPSKNSVIYGSMAVAATSLKKKVDVDNMRKRLSSNQFAQKNIGSSPTYAINDQKAKEQSIFKK